MKVVMTTHTYQPYKDGVQAVNKYLAEGLAARGVNVTIVTQSNPDAPSKETINGVNIVRLPIYNIHTIYRGDKKEYQNLIIKLTENADALINVAADTPWTDWCFELLDIVKCKKILYLHGMYDFKWHTYDFKSLSSFGHKIWNSVRWVFHYTFLKNKVRKYDIVTQLHIDDDASIYYAKHYGIQGHVIENAAEAQFFEDVDKNIDVDTPVRYAIFVGNYIERKNQEYALKALYTSKTEKELGIVFIGSEETNYYLKLQKLNNDLRQKYGYRDVRFLTHVERNKVREYIKRAEMCVVGSTWEAYPVAVVECMAAGVPFITTDVGCVRYLPGGIVVKSIYEMRRWMEILDQNHDCAKALGNAGRLYSKHHQSTEVCVEQLIELIK